MSFCFLYFKKVFPIYIYEKGFHIYIYIGKLNVILMFISDSVYVAGLQTGTPCFEALQ